MLATFIRVTLTVVGYIINLNLSFQFFFYGSEHQNLSPFTIEVIIVSVAWLEKTMVQLP